jgi:hypothetical protein
MGRELSGTVVDLAARIVALVREHPDQPYTYPMLGDALDVDHTKTTFRLALAEARNQAAQAGGCITGCVWDRSVGARALRYLEGPGKSPKPHHTVVSHPRFAKATLEAHVRASSDDPLYGTVLQNAAEAAAAMEQFTLSVVDLVRLSRLQQETIDRQREELASLRNLLGRSAVHAAS